MKTMKMLTKILIVSSLLFVTFSTTKVKAEEGAIISANRWGIALTMEEIELLGRIVQLECGHDIQESKCATIETIFNRIFDPRYPNTLEEVLSQKGQFSTWKNRNISKATPTTINIVVPPKVKFKLVNLSNIGRIAITAKNNPPNQINFFIIPDK